MTDDDLIDLIDRVSPADLTPEECAMIRTAARNSPEVRRACLERIGLEEQLAAVLGRPHVSVDALLAGRRRPGAGQGRGPWLTLAVLCLLTAGLGTIVVARWRPRPDADPGTANAEADPMATVVATVAREPDAVADAKPEAAAAPDATAAAAAAPESAVAATAAAAATAVTPPPENSPWARTLAAGPAAPTLDDLFRHMPIRENIDRSELQAWFTPLPGTPWKILRPRAVGKTRQRTLSAMEGRFRLAAPLHEGTALRLMIHDPQGLRITAWSGTRGATIEVDGSPPARWCGSVLVRPAADRPVERRWLTSTSDGRGERVGIAWQPGVGDFLGIVELRFIRGSLVLSRGEVRLIEVPLPEPPEEILFEGQLAIGGVELVRAVEPPPLPPPPPATVQWQPADLPWTGPAAAAVEKRPDGSVRLARADGGATPLVAICRLPPAAFGPRETLLQITDYTPGSGVVLTGTDGKPAVVCGFVKPDATKIPDRQGAIFMAWTPDNSPITGGGRDRFAFAPPTVWLRLSLVNSGLVISWSGDGNTWARLREFPPAALPGGIAGVGLFAGGHPAQAITLTSVGVAELPGLAKILPRDLLAAIDPLLATGGEIKDPVSWSQRWLERLPSGVAASRWMAAAAIRTLATSAANHAPTLGRFAWQHARSLDMPLEDRLAVCDDLNRLTKIRTPQEATPLDGIYGLVAGDCLARGDTAGYRAAWLRLQQAPNDASGPSLTQHSFDPLRVQVEALRRRVFDGPGPALRAEVMRQRFYATDATTAEAEEREFEPGEPPMPETDTSWAEAVADFRATIDAGNWDGAQRTLARIAAESGGRLLDQGLVQDEHDGDRFFPLWSVVDDALRERAEFRSFMLEGPAERGRLRLGQLRASGDARGLAVAADEFPGTPAAVEALEWLATRSLAAGDVPAARSAVRAGLTWAGPEPRDRLLAIDALARAIAEDDVETLPAAAVGSVSGGELTAAITAMRRTRRTPVAAAPAPGDVAAVKRATLVAPASAQIRIDVAASPGPLPGITFPRSPPFFRTRFDWVGESCAVLPHGDRLLASNGWSVTSIDAATGAVHWQTPVAPKTDRPAVGGLVPLRPACGPRHVFVRRFATGRTTTVAALDADSGAVAWESRPDAATPPLSDPVFADGMLLWCEGKFDTRNFMLLVGADPTTGQRKFTRPLCVLRPGWLNSRPGGGAAEPGDCQIAVVDGRLFIALGGTVLCCDAGGRLQWARRLPWISAAADPGWYHRSPAPPLHHAGTLFVMPPGVPGLVAVAADSGRLVWKTPLPSARRVVGIAGSAAAAWVVVETEAGLVACDVRDGTPRLILDGRDGPGDPWLGISPARLLGAATTTADGLAIVAVQTRRADADKSGMLDASLVWIDVGSGAIRHTAPLPALAGNPPWLGPMAAADGRLWLLAAPEPSPAPTDPRRAVWELAPAPAP